MNLTTIPVQHIDLIPRQCGTRHDGAAYTVDDPIVDLATLIEFLINDGIPFPTKDLNLCHQGMNPILRPGCDPDDPIYDFYDVIGGDYDWVWDDIREQMVLGSSRKFPKDLIHLVDEHGRSMHIRVHDRAIASDGTNVLDLHELQVPSNKDTIYGKQLQYQRNLACGADYVAGSRRDEQVTYEQGAYMWTPITTFHVIEDTTNQTHLGAMDKLSQLGFDFSLVDN